ncbi:MAG: biotin transporter BioY [Firmicutes bacterium]|nr:biotin transporter BioY [Bacillota bacterium]
MSHSKDAVTANQTTPSTHTVTKSAGSTRTIVYAAASIALITVCSWIAVPTAIPFTLQTFAVCLVSALMGWKIGLFSLLGYILLGAIGVPVFSNFSGGFAALIGPTGGYIIGFLATAFIVGFAAERFGRKWLPLLIAMVLGILVCYAFGTAWFMVVYTRNTGDIGLMTALGWCVFPYIPADALKAVLAMLLTVRIYPVLAKHM